MKSNNDVLTPEVIEEIPLEKVIDNELVKHNVTEAVIAGLKDKYGELRLNNINDKENYLIIKDAKKEVRKYGILTEKLCKAGREDAIKIQKLWLAKEKEVLGKIAAVENPLQAEIDRFDANLERIEQEKIKRQEDAFIQRQSDLAKMGAVYANGCFNLNDIAYESNLIKEADQDVWENSILAKYRVQYEKNESVRLAEEKRRQEAAESLRIAQEEMARRQKEMDDREAAFKKAEDERLSAIRLEAEESDRKRREQLEVRSKKRGYQLQALGMSFNFQSMAYVFEDVTVHNNEISLKADNEWDDLVEQITGIIEDRKADAEVKRLAKIEEDKRIAAEAAIKAERERVERDQAMAKLKLEQEAEEKQRQLEAASDKEKWGAWVKAVGQLLPITTMKSASYKRKAQIAAEKLEEIISL